MGLVFFQKIVNFQYIYKSTTSSTSFLPNHLINAKFSFLILNIKISLFLQTLILQSWGPLKNSKILKVFADFALSLKTFCESIEYKSNCFAVGAGSQWCSNERMMVYFKLMMVKRLLMMVKCKSMMVKCVYDHKVNSPSLTSISPSLTSISPSLMSILPSLAGSKTSFAHLTIIEKLHRLFWKGRDVYYKYADIEMNVILWREIYF